MFAVVFEVAPRDGQWDAYLDLARLLKPELEAIDGFVDNERFESERRRGRVLSLSTWRDEKAVVRWRTQAAHHAVQVKGRVEVFEDYHLRVGEITADSEAARALPQHRLDETEVGEGKALTISELAPPEAATRIDRDLAADLGLGDGDDGVLSHETFRSIYTEGKRLLLATWRTAAAAERFVPRVPGGGRLRHRRLRVIRDYGMLDRREAPQFYPPVGRRPSPSGSA